MIAIIANRTITVESYSRDGKPTCAISPSHRCEFLGSGMRGEICLPLGERPNRDRDGYGYLLPCADCPVWRGALPE